MNLNLAPFFKANLTFALGTCFTSALFLLVSCHPSFISPGYSLNDHGVGSSKVSRHKTDGTVTVRQCHGVVPFFVSRSHDVNLEIWDHT